MILSADSWLDGKSSFFDIENQPYTIKWMHHIEEDLFDLSCSFYQAAYITTRDILSEPRDNVKMDMWFLPSVYLFRQSLELIAKALLARRLKKDDFQRSISKSKHNIKEIFDEYINASIKHRMALSVSQEKFNWLQRYLTSLETVDKNSNLFRYPFKDKFLSECGSEFLHIVNMGNSFLNAYSILYEEYQGNISSESDVTEFNKSFAVTFLSFAYSGMWNCMLDESPLDDHFHKQVIGYSDVSEFLKKRYDADHSVNLMFPILFLIRNAIELGLKRMIYADVIQPVDVRRVIDAKHTHILMDIWKCIRPRIEYYAEEHGENLETLDIIENRLSELTRIDKNGDVFRYPFSKSLDYRVFEKTIDFDHVYEWMAQIFNIVDGCDAILQLAADYEADARADCW